MDVCEKNKTEKAVVNHEANNPAPRKMQQLDNRLSVNQLPEKVDGIFEKETREKKVDPSIFKQRSSGVTVPATISIDRKITFFF